MCNFLEIKPQLYYYHINRKPKRSPKFYLDKQVKKRVKDIFESSNVTGKGGVYGARKIAFIYNKQVSTNGGDKLSPYQILKVMKQLNVSSNYHKRRNKKQAPTPSKDAKFAPNILNREYDADLNHTLSCDLTYINTSKGFYYVCFIIDLWNREIVGYNISKNHDTECVFNAINNMSTPISKYKVFHSDRGGEFAAKQLNLFLQKNSVKLSMSTPGCPYDNAVSENLFKLLKTEGTQKYYRDIDNLYGDVSTWVKWYNNIRVHSTLNYKSPMQYRLEKFD